MSASASRSTAVCSGRVRHPGDDGEQRVGEVASDHGADLRHFASRADRAAPSAIAAASTGSRGCHPGRRAPIRAASPPRRKAARRRCARRRPPSRHAAALRLEGNIGIESLSICPKLGWTASRPLVAAMREISDWFRKLPASPRGPRGGRQSQDQSVLRKLTRSSFCCRVKPIPKR
jgi:hypothetical protein